MRVFKSKHKIIYSGGGQGRGHLTGRVSEPEMFFLGEMSGGLVLSNFVIGSFTVSFQMAQTNTTTAIRLRSLF